MKNVAPINLTPCMHGRNRGEGSQKIEDEEEEEKVTKSASQSVTHFVGHCELGGLGNFCEELARQFFTRKTRRKISDLQSSCESKLFFNNISCHSLSFAHSIIPQSGLILIF